MREPAALHRFRNLCPCHSRHRQGALLDHRDALDNKELPASLAIIGGGVIGMEFASFFNSLGVEVHVVEMLDKILGPMDRGAVRNVASGIR